MGSALVEIIGKYGEDAGEHLKEKIESLIV